MLWKNRCYNGGKKHRFKAVYEETEAPWVSNVERIRGPSRETMFEKVYIKHVCLWCGMQINPPIVKGN